MPLEACSSVFALGTGGMKLLSLLFLCRLLEVAADDLYKPCPKIPNPSWATDHEIISD
jgi:hypothetical protein